jgi:glutamate racemase
MKILKPVIAALCLFGSSCDRQPGSLEVHDPFIRDVLTNKNGFYYLDYREPRDRRSLAVGVFDSGIGGLTVFDAIIHYDQHDAEGRENPDGIRDFRQEQFVYLADQANMPYSNYPEIDKAELLVEHVLKDALFLVNGRYNPSPDSDEVRYGKPPVKTIVIACNTATAYGKDKIEQLFRQTGIEVHVIGIVDAGAKGAVESFDGKESGVIAVFATPATVKSGAYVSSIRRMLEQNRYSGDIRIIQHGGKGLHEAIENKPGFINTATSSIDRDYQGPSFSDDLYRIDRDLLEVYRFDTTGNHILCNHGNIHRSDTIQLNSVENYVRYHIVALVEKIRNSGFNSPLKSIVLGCTHYPYVIDEIEKVLAGLRSMPVYEDILSDTIILIDPSLNTAAELYRYLDENDLLNTRDRQRLDESMFFISVPNTYNSKVSVTAEGAFTYRYQYLDRNINELQEYTLVVPLTERILSDLQLGEIRKNVPGTYKLIQKFTN